MKKSDSQKLDTIITMLADIVDVFGKRFDKIDDALTDHTKTLDDHTRDLAQIKNDVETDLDKRLQLEVRVDKLEKSRA